MTHGTKAQILEIVKKECLGFYQMLNKIQQQQFKDFPQKLQEAKTTREAKDLTHPIYLLVKKNQAE